MINNIKTIETKGFCLVKNSLTEEEINLIINDYKINSMDSNKNYDISLPSSSLLEVLIPKLSQLINVVTTQTNVCANVYTKEAMYINNSRVNFDWHQDHENFYVLRESYNYINCYIPIVKKNPLKSGISLIPMDVLKINYPELFNQLFNNGAQQVNKENNGVIRIYNAETNQNFFYEINIEDFSVSPELNVGDILLIRGDVLHKTQDTDDERVALSVRFTDGNIIIDYDKLFYQLSKKKKEMMLNNAKRYEKIKNIFNTRGVKKLSFKDIL